MNDRPLWAPDKRKLPNEFYEALPYILLIITAFNFLYVKLLYLSLNGLLKSNVNGLMFVNFFVSAIK